MTLARDIFRALADGGVHSGEALADAAGVTRSAIWKAIGQLREQGLPIDAQTNRGYRLLHPCEPLDPAAMRSRLPKEIDAVTAIAVEWELASTNATLLESTAPLPGRFSVLLAENQTGGRGRRGRAWQAALGGSLCLSIATSFEPLPRDLPALTLAIGVCVLEALQHAGARGLALKWPNDLVVVDQTSLIKVGGILVELRAEAGGPGHVVIGIGLNLRLGEEARAAIAAAGTAAGDIASLGADAGARNQIAAAVIDRCIAGLQRFARDGFAPFIEDWRTADALRDRTVRVSEPGGARDGVARGIDTQGGLQLEMQGGKRVSIVGGEVSVRQHEP